MHQDLLEQARALATDSPGKPKQVSLRRSISAAYYALFHFLVSEACRAIIGAQHDQRGYRDALARAFAHSSMKSACSSFAGGQLPASVMKPLPRNPQGQYAIAQEIRTIAHTFSELQRRRNLADYDPSERFKRSEVLVLIEQVEDVIEDFASLPTSNDRRFFLVCLLSWRELSNR